MPKYVSASVSRYADGTSSSAGVFLGDFYEADAHEVKALGGIAWRAITWPERKHQSTLLQVRDEIGESSENIGTPRR